MEIYRKKLAEPLKLEIRSVGENELRFDWLEFVTHHSQDCCESVYWDFEEINVEQILQLHTIEEVSISTEKDAWFTIFFYPLDPRKDRHWVFVPCRNIQNWYYSSDLSLEIYVGGICDSFDISDTCNDDIN